jgi:hypothetical protein
MGVKLDVLTLREERRLRLFENSVLRKIFGPKRNEVTRGWRKLNNEELRYNQVEEDEMDGACSTNGREEERV